MVPGCESKCEVPEKKTSLVALAGSRSKNKWIKLVFRRLPNKFNEEKLFSIIGPFDDRIIWWKISDENLQEIWNTNIPIYKRAYIALKDPLVNLAQFEEHVKGLDVIYDHHKNAYLIIVEVAPYQLIPPKSFKPDHRNNTINDDLDYKKFVASFEQNDSSKNV